MTVASMPMWSAVDAVHAGPRQARAAEDVAAADDAARPATPRSLDLEDFARDALQDRRIDAVVGRAQQRLAATASRMRL